MAEIVALAAAIAPAAAVGVGVYSIVQQSRAAKAAEKMQEKAQTAAELQQQREFELYERQAGEHLELSKQQMELQAQAGNIMTLTDVLTRERPPAQPQILTLPPAKEYTGVERINQAIDDMLRAA